MADLTRILRGSHPFLSSPGPWILAGHGMHGSPLNKVPMHGETEVRHEGGKVINEGAMRLVSSAPSASFTSRYEITPTEDRLRFDFFQANTEVGNLHGTVVAIDDRLVSTYASGDGTLTGMEVMHRLGDFRYAVTGSLVSQGQLVSVWKFDMVRPAGNAQEDKIVSEKGGA